MSDINTVQVQESVVTPDIYEDGFPCHFISYHDGDMSEEKHSDPVIFNVADYPAGTKITLSIPSCPDCGEVRETTYKSKKKGKVVVDSHASECECGFDWINWQDENFD